MRKLRELSRLPVNFLDGSFSFDTIADQDNYGAGHLGFPVDLYAWTGQPRIVDSVNPLLVRQFLSGPVPIGELRQTGLVANLKGLYPYQFAWHNDFMWLAWKPTGIVTIAGDYRRDGRRDSVTGALITTASTTHTNGWFDEGENALRCAVLLEYHETISKDGKSIQLYRDQLYGSQDGKTTGLLKVLQQSRDAKRDGTAQGEDTMFTAWGREPRKRAWRSA